MSRSVLCLLLFVIGLAVPASAEIEVLTDRFDGTIRVRTKLQVPTSIPLIALVGAYSGKEGTLSITMLLERMAESWRYLDCHETKWLVDDEPFQLPQPTHRGNVGSGYVTEYLIIAPVTLAQIGDAIADGQKTSNLGLQHYFGKLLRLHKNLIFFKGF